MGLRVLEGGAVFGVRNLESQQEIIEFRRTRCSLRTAEGFFYKLLRSLMEGKYGRYLLNFILQF
jgi:hypothetical protein